VKERASSGVPYKTRSFVCPVCVCVRAVPVFGGSRALKIRVDAFNALNHTQFNDVNATIEWQSMTNLTPANLPYKAAGVLTNPTGFGTVTSVRPARVVQLLVRFDF
jgi:hypothetical protein